LKSRIVGELFFPDGKTILTRSDDKIARLRPRDVCRSIEEIATELRKRIGRDLTDEEPHRFGLPDQ
jgi:hypothetical protein